MQEVLGLPSEPENAGGLVPLQPGQCWRIKQAIAPFGEIGILLATGQMSTGEKFWEVAVPTAEGAAEFLEQLRVGCFVGRGSDLRKGSEAGLSMEKQLPPAEPGDGVVLGVPEEFLQPRLQQLLADGLVPSQVRHLLQIPDRVHFIQGPLEEGLREVAAAWQWQTQQVLSPSAENFLRAIREGHSETVDRMLSMESSLLEQWLGEASAGQAPPSGRAMGEPFAPLAGTPSTKDVGALLRPDLAPAPALCWAVRFARAEMVELLLEKGAKVDAADTEGNTPLHWAARLGHLDIARLLLEHGAAVDRANQQGERPVLLAARSPAWEAPRVAQLLLDAGAQADLNSLVALGQVEEILQRLQTPDPLATATQPDQLLQDALWAIRRAISRRMDPAVVDQDVLDSVMAEYLPILQRFLALGVDPNAGFPLWTAVQLPDPRPTALLLQWGADPNQKIHENMFPLEVARTEPIRRLLRQHGAKHPEDPDLVVERLSQRLAQCPEDPEALRRRAEAWAQLGRFQEALADWAALIQLAPEQPEGYLGQAWIWASSPQEQFRDGQAALQSAQRAVELAGGWETLASQRVWDEKSGHVSVRTEYWLTYAASLAELARFQEAVQVLEQVLPLASPAERARIRYLRALFAAGRAYRARPPEEEQLFYEQLAQEPSSPKGFWARVKTWWSRCVGIFQGKGDRGGRTHHPPLGSK